MYTCVMAWASERDINFLLDVDREIEFLSDINARRASEEFGLVCNVRVSRNFRVK